MQMNKMELKLHKEQKTRANTKLFPDKKIPDNLNLQIFKLEHFNVKKLVEKKIKSNINKIMLTFARELCQQIPWLTIQKNCKRARKKKLYKIRF